MAVGRLTAVSGSTAGPIGRSKPSGLEWKRRASSCPSRFRPHVPNGRFQARANGYWGELLEPRLRSVKADRDEQALRPPLGQRREDRLRPMAGEGGGDVRADLEAPVGALVVGSRQIGRDRFANEVIELGVSEHRR